jgi:hypothetical protein
MADWSRLEGGSAVAVPDLLDRVEPGSSSVGMNPGEQHPLRPRAAPSAAGRASPWRRPSAGRPALLGDAAHPDQSTSQAFVDYAVTPADIAGDDRLPQIATLNDK